MSSVCPHIRFKYLCLGFIIYFSLQVGLAQEVKYKHYTTNDGLAHNIGFDILQSKDGRIWIGTDEGISIYDGQRFVNLTQGDGLLGTSVIALSENPYREEVYASVYKVGVNVINTKGEITQLSEPKGFLIPNMTYYPVFSFSENGRVIFHNPNHVQCLLTVAEPLKESMEISYLFLFKKEGSLQLDVYGKKDSVRQKVKGRLHEASGIKVHLFVSDAQRSYLATSMGFYELSKDKKLHQPFPNLPEKENYQVIRQDKFQNLWLAGENHLYKINEKEGLISKYPLPDPELEVIQMRIISEREIYLLDKSREKFILWDPIDRKATNLFETMQINAGISYIEKDIENNIWLTTDGDGVYNIYNHNFSNHSLSSSYKQNFINDLKVDDKGHVWIATKEGLFRHQNGDWEFFDSPRPRDREIIKLHYRKQDGIYIVHRRGIEKVMAPKKFLACNIKFSTYLTITQNGEFAYLSDSHLTNNNSTGFNQYICLQEDCLQLPTDSILVPDALAKHGFRARNLIYHEKDDGHTWISYNQKILRKEGITFTIYGEAEGLPSNLVNDLTEDLEGNIWLATEFGVVKFTADPSRPFQSFASLPKLPVRQILFDKKGNLWMGSPRGLFLWDGERLVHYNAQSGLITNDVTSICIDHEDQLWVGTSAGLSILDLNKPLIKRELPPLFFDNIQIDGVAIEPESGIEIIQRSLIEVSYRSITFITNNVLQYEYRLSEQSKWQATEQPNLSFTNMETGFYRLQIRVKSPISDWSEPLQWEFYIVPPWYRSVWAMSMWAILLGLLILIAFYLRINAVKKAEAEKTRINKRIAEIELKTLQAQINPHFIFNALNAIQSYTLEQDTISANIYLTRFAKLMRLFLEASKKNRIRLSEEVEMLKLYIEMEQICNEGKFEYELHLEDELDLEEIYVPSMLIQPFVENAIRHGIFHKLEKGMIDIYFQRMGERLLCLIDDDGVGRAASLAIKKKSFKEHVSRGMQIVNERLEMQNFIEGTNIKIEVKDKYATDQKPLGTQVFIWIPLFE